MTFSKSRFTLFYSMPLSPADWQNLEASRVRMVMLPLSLAVAHSGILTRLAQMGCRTVLRVEEGTYRDDDAGNRIGRAVAHCAEICPNEAVIVGVEPENGVHFTYGSPWEQTGAYAHRRTFDAVRVALQLRGNTVVAPGWTKRSISEDDPPQAGRAAWREICTLPERSDYDPEGMSYGYHSCAGVGHHEYQHAWLGPVDELRLKFSLQHAQEMWHRPIWIDEIGVNTGSQVERMRAYIDIAEMLLEHRLGRRVEMLCPFVSNGDPGNPPVWDARFVLSDPRCYAMLGDWMAEE